MADHDTPVSLARDYSCALHETHSPVNLLIEHHHVIPQAWQHTWAPAKAKLDSSGLWDPRTTPICPTGHRNVHVLLVALMQAAAADGPPIDIAAAVLAVKPRGHVSEFATARLATERFTAAGGKLEDLAIAGEWGMS